MIAEHDTDPHDGGPMTRGDLERLSKEYAAAERREGRLARALQVDIPVWRELGNEILGDLDEGKFGESVLPKAATP